MPDPDVKEDALMEEFDNWLDFVKSGALLRLEKVFKKHSDYCKNKVCSNVDVGDFQNASKWQAKASHTNTLIKLIRDRIDEVESKEKGGKKND